MEEPPHEPPTQPAKFPRTDDGRRVWSAGPVLPAGNFRTGCRAILRSAQTQRVCSYRAERARDALHSQSGDGPGYCDIAFHAAGRGTGMRLDDDPYRISWSESGVWRESGGGGKRQYPNLM